MKLILALLLSFLTLAAAEEKQQHGPDSKPQEGVPKGKVTEHIHESKIFAGTKRKYYVYVPAQYKQGTPAAVMVFQDGHTYRNEKGDFRVPVVFDNLIHKGEMPVTIAIMLNPGHKGDSVPKTPWKNNNRSFEYDTLSDQYAKMLIEELIPEVGKNYTLTEDRKMRAICGISSGGICAFTAAWQKPDYFHKVLSHIGSFTNIRGGHVYPALIRKDKKRDIRVYLQDGEKDLDNAHGNWWLSNLQMDKALAFSKYDYKFVPTKGAHNGKDGGYILPDALRWLWRDWKN
ncbi:MAG: alpha/beta hydrolase-fold protein [Lentisphaeraceae bacterium]|nr:alpha/beta hydrolase-fold protein [Lentisphaeraceae bacterium]